MARLGLIWAQAHAGVIGAGGGMPWHVPEDLAHFKAVTLGAPVIMGRRTWDALPARFRPLPGRDNIVLTRRPAAAGAVRAASLVDALRIAAGSAGEWIWVIGGGRVLREALPSADRLEVTELDLDVPGDTVAPATTGWRVVAADPAAGWHTSRGGVRYRFLRRER